MSKPDLRIVKEKLPVIQRARCNLHGVLHSTLKVHIAPQIGISGRVDEKSGTLIHVCPMCYLADPEFPVEVGR